MVFAPGRAALIRRIASIVAIPAPRNSSSPDPSVNVSVSKIMSWGRMPYFPTARSCIRRATASFASAVFAIPFSSIVSAMTAAP